jgi:hypothetical protein
MIAFLLVLIGVPVAIVLILAYIQYRRNYRKMVKRLIKELKVQQRYDRIYKWKRRALEWREEQKRPVIVQFDCSLSFK